VVLSGATRELAPKLDVLLGLGTLSLSEMSNHLDAGLARQQGERPARRSHVRRRVAAGGEKLHLFARDGENIFIH
jgi:hypothetical protein